jgi:hypothetical protein
MADSQAVVALQAEESAPVAIFQGHDSVTGAGRSTAVQGKTTIVGGTNNASYAICEDVNSLATTLNISQSLSAGYGSIFSVDEKMKFFRSLKVTSTSVSIVVSARHIKGKEVKTSVVLAEGVTSPGSDPIAIQEFVRVFGDSYLTSVTTGGEYYAVYTFYSETKEEKQSLKADLQAHGLYGSGKVDASLQMNLNTFTNSTNVRVGFAQTMSGIQNQKMPKQAELVQFATDYTSLPLDNPIVIAFTSEGYEHVVGFGTFGALPAARRYFVQDGATTLSLASSLTQVLQLKNQIDWLEGIYRFYDYSGDTKLVEAKEMVKGDLKSINEQMYGWEDNPMQSFTAPSLPSLELGTPSLQFTTGRTDEHGGYLGDPFDDVDTATCMARQWRIASLQLRGAGGVDKLTVEYESILGRVRREHGGGGGAATNVLTLNPGVNLKSISFRSAERLESVLFELTDGNSLGTGSNHYHSLCKRIVPDGSVWLGFTGRSGEFLDQLSAVYGTLRPARWNPI